MAKGREHERRRLRILREEGALEEAALEARGALLCAAEQRERKSARLWALHDKTERKR